MIKNDLYEMDSRIDVLIKESTKNRDELVTQLLSEEFDKNMVEWSIL